jgi:hypothetical protein
MSEEELEQLAYLAELNGLSDAHLVGGAFEEAGIAYKVAANTSSGFGVVMPQSWGMLYADASKREEALQILAAVRDDERQADANYDPDAEVEIQPEVDEAPSAGD